MRRLLLGLSLCGFLTLVGLQAAHSHKDPGAAPDSCSVCSLGTQTVKQAPGSAPAFIAAAVWVGAARETGVSGLAPSRAEASARAPPTA